MEQRGPSDPRALITDIDGTLFDGTTPITSVIDYVNAFDGAIIVVTSRFVGDRDATEQQLSGVVRFDELIMRSDSVEEDVYKERAARDVLDKFNVVVAIDNSDAARDAYARLGIPTIDPSDAESDDIRAVLVGKVPRVSATTVEQRFVDVADIEVRDGTAGDGMSFTGFAAVYNSRSQDLGGFTETIAPGAFARSLKSRNEIRMYVNHNADMVLASRRSGTLRLTDTDRGLRVDADLPDTTYGRDLSVLMRRGDVSSMSFGFSVPPKGDTWSADGSQRELRDVRLHEVSVVTGFPAYTATTAQVRSLEALSEKTGIDAVRMNDAITKLEQGEELSADDAALLDEAIAKLKTPASEELVTHSATDLLLKKKKLDLLYAAA
jgi:HK97 family phage prohead protease